MTSELVIVFNFIISQWSLSPEAFKDAVLLRRFPQGGAGGHLVVDAHPGR